MNCRMIFIFFCGHFLSTRRHVYLELNRFNESSFDQNDADTTAVPITMYPANIVMIMIFVLKFLENKSLYSREMKV